MNNKEARFRPVSTARNRKLRRRFAVTIAVFFVLVLSLWIVYQNTVFSHIQAITAEMTALIENNLLTALNDEFSGMNRSLTLIAGDAGVQAFLAETDVRRRYERSQDVAVIIRKAVYTNLSVDNILTVTADGSFFQFIGGVSSGGISMLGNEVIKDRVTVYTVLELDGAKFFCLTSPVYQRVAGKSAPVGYVVALSNLTKIRRILTRFDAPPGIDAAVIADGVILFSSNPALDGQSAEELDRLYGSVTTARVASGELYAATAVSEHALHYGERLFLTVSFAALLLLIAGILILYRWLSLNMVSPMLQNAEDMQMGLLKLQISAHFVVNTISCIRGLSEKGENEKAALAAEHLAGMLRNLHESDDESGLDDQIKNLNRFISIMNIRHDDRFTAAVEVDDRLSHYKMLRQILQPLAENALTHGLAAKTEDCRLAVYGRMESGCLVFEVSDNGVGMEPEIIRELQSRLDAVSDWDYNEHRLNGVALVNIQKRVRARYGNRYGLTISGAPGCGLTITVRLPLIRDEQD